MASFYTAEANDVEVAQEEQVPDRVSGLDRRRHADEELQQRIDDEAVREGRVVERPDPQDAPHVEGAHVEATGAVDLRQDQVGDQESAQDEEEGHADATGARDAESVLEVDEEERQESEPVEVREEDATVTPGSVLMGYGDSSRWTGLRRVAPRSSGFVGFRDPRLRARPGPTTAAFRRRSRRTRRSPPGPSSGPPRRRSE